MRNHPVAVLSGDLKGSSRAAPEATEAAMAALADAAGAAALWPGMAPMRFTRTRGDGWQAVARAPGLALRVALYLAARLRALPSELATRIAIGVGGIDHLGGTDLADARGAAFSLSGRTLDRMGPSMLAGASEGEGAAEARLRAMVLRLIGERIGRWTPEQAEAVALALPPGQPALADIADDLRISRQAVSYRLQGAGFPTLRAVLREWERDFTAPPPVTGDAR